MPTASSCSISEVVSIFRGHFNTACTPGLIMERAQATRPLCSRAARVQVLNGGELVTGMEIHAVLAECRSL